VSGTDATDDDLSRASAFLVAWDLDVRQLYYDDGVTRIPTAEKRNEAMHALAQAFAEERGIGEDESRWLAVDLARMGAAYRRAVGVVSDLLKLTNEATAVVDSFATPPRLPRDVATPRPEGLACLANVETFAGGRLVGRAICWKPRGHKGKHGP
jgi:hypothetical protein